MNIRLHRIPVIVIALITLISLAEAIGLAEFHPMTVKIAFSAAPYVADEDGKFYRPASEGTGTGPITWTERFICDISGSTYAAPIRVSPKGAGVGIMQYETAAISEDEDNDAFGYDGTGTYQDTVFDSDDWYYNPQWEEFDMNSSGKVIVFCSTYWGTHKGYKLRISSDYGRTWADPIDIDYLYNLLGATKYGVSNAGYQGASLQLNELTGVWYLLCQYRDPANSHVMFALMSSATGTSWTHIKTWDATSLGYYGNVCSLAVSGDYIYAGFISTSPNQYCHYSSDGGGTWNSHAFAVHSDVTYCPIALTAHEGSAIALIPTKISDHGTPPTWTNHLIIMRTSDGGANWAQTLSVDANDDLAIQYNEYAQARSTGDIFLVTCCDAGNPMNASWTASDGTHDITGTGESYLCFWISLDGGATWAIANGPYLKIDSEGNHTHYQQSIDVTVVAADRGCFWPILLLLADDLPPCAPEKRPSTKCVTPGL